MRKQLMRTVVLGAMVAVLSSATAAIAQPPAGPPDPVQEFRAGERASQAQPASTADEPSVAQQRRWNYESTRVQAPVASAEPAERGTPVALLAALAAAAVLALSLDALSVRRKARKAAARAAT
jgi:hypothetical protein